MADLTAFKLVKNVGSDHYLVETRLKLKLKRSPREKEGRTRFDMQKLADEEIRNKYNIEVRNRFQVLEGLEEEENAEQKNNRMENIYVATAKERKSVEHHVNVRNPRRAYRIGEGAVLDEGGTTEWFQVQSGVKQGCVMSGFLFLFAIDWVMSRTTEGRRTGIRWKFTSVLEDLDFADNIALLSSRYVDKRNKTSRLVDEAARVSLRVNAKKSKVMRVNARNDQGLEINGEQVDEVEEFVYLGALLDKEGGTTKDIQHRLSKARQAFYRMRRLWDTSEIGRKMKVQLFKTIVRSVLMYGCEAWKLMKTEAKKLDGFQYKCMKRILRIRWPQTISHQQIQENTGVNRTSDEIRRRRWNWIGHIMRKGREEHCVTALEWRPEGRRRPGRPKTTWRRMVEDERQTAGWQSWANVRALAANRSG
ncbi:hypothetical protein ACROYT_G021383 [Oculina patagonica]